MTFRYPNQQEKENLLLYILVEKLLTREYLAEFGEIGTLAHASKSINDTHVAQKSSGKFRQDQDPQRGVLATQLLRQFPWIEKICERQTFLKPYIHYFIFVALFFILENPGICLSG